MVYFREALYALVLLAFVLQDAVHGLRIGTSSKMSIRAQRQTLMMSAENIAVLRQAAFTRDVDRRDVIDNIRQLDTQSEKVKIDPTSVKGKWELVFSSIPGGAANGFLIGGFFDGYFSIKEIVDFFECSLKTAVGSFRGPPSELKSTTPLEIEFVYTTFKVGPIPAQEVPPNVRSHRFLYVDDDIAVTVTSSGGGTLLKRV